MKKVWRVPITILLLGIATLLLFGMPNYRTIRQNRLNQQLLRAVYHADVSAATDLLNQGANVDTTDNNPLLDILERLHNNEPPVGTHTVLTLACTDGKIQLVQLLLQHGADVNRRDDTGTTPLMWAVMAQTPSIVALLLDKGAQIDAADAQGCTALMDAARRGNLLIVKQLLKRKANLKARDIHGYTASTWASHNGFPQVSAILKQAESRK